MHCWVSHSHFDIMFNWNRFASNCHITVMQFMIFFTINNIAKSSICNQTILCNPLLIHITMKSIFSHFMHSTNRVALFLKLARLEYIHLTISLAETHINRVKISNFRHFLFFLFLKTFFCILCLIILYIKFFFWFIF